MVDVSFDNTIWKMLDRVRVANGLSGHEFGVGLGALIFLRWADFQEAEQEAIAAFDDVDYAPALAPRYHWRAWHNAHPEELQRLFLELPRILHSLANSRHDQLATQFHRVAPAVEKLSRFPVDALAHLVHWLSDQPFETPSDRLAMRDVFDEVMRRATDRSMSQFFTPRDVVEMMVTLAEPQHGESVYDPCFGSGGFLTAAVDYVREHEPDKSRSGRQPLKLAGIERLSESFVIGLLRLALTGISDPQLEVGNSLERIGPTNPSVEGYDVVITNPPWGGKIREDYGLRHYPIPSKDSVMLFIQHAISQLRPGGRAVIAVPPGNLFRGGREKALREMLLSEHTVDAVVGLPAGAFQPYTSIASCILMLRKGGQTKSVRMVDLSSDKKSKPNKTGVFHSPQEVVELVWEPRPGRFAWDVDVETLEQLDFDLSPKKRNQSALESLLNALPDDVEIRSLKDRCSVTSGRSIPSRDLFLDVPSDKGREMRDQLAYDQQGLIEQLNELDDTDPDTRPERIDLWARIESLSQEIENCEEFGTNDCPYIRIRDLVGGVVQAGSAWLRPGAADAIDPKGKLKHGDVLVSKSGTIGKTGIVRNGAVGGVPANSFFVLRVDNDQLDPHYLMAYLNSAECSFWLQERARGSAAKHLSTAAFKELLVPIPPLQIQRRVAAEHNELRADAVEVLTRLLTGGESNAVAQWLSRHWTAVSNKDPGSLQLAYWQSLADEFRRLRNEVAHSTENVGPLTDWTLAFGEALTPLRGANDVSDGLTLFSILNEVAQRLEQARGAASGELPDSKKARAFTDAFEKWLTLTTESMVSRSHLVITTNVTELVAGELTEVSLAVRNNGELPMRSLRLFSEPHFTDVDIPFLAAGASAEAQVSIFVPTEESQLDLVIDWEGLSMDGNEISGTKDVRFSVASTAVQGADVADLGASPYVTGDPVKADRNDVFFGREKLIDRIRRQVMQSGNVVLLEGNRRAGKSSVLWHLEGVDAIPGWLGIYCSLQGAEGDSEGGIPTAEVFRNIAYEIVQAVRRLNGSAVLPDGTELDANRRLGIARSLREGISEEAPFQDFREYLELILETLAEKELGVLLMLDEFDKLQEGIDKGITSPQVPENVRFLVQTYPRFSAVLTGSRRLKRMREEYWSALFGLGTRVGVSALPIDAAARLVTEPVAGRLSYSKSAIKRAHELTAGQPYLLQCLCNRVFDIAATTSVRSITVDQVNAAADALVEDNEHFASLWDYIGFDRRRFLLYLLHLEQEGRDPMRLGVIEAKLEKAGIELRESVVIADLEALRELELVAMHGESSGAHYSLEIPMMGQWLDSQQDYEVLLSRARVEAEDISGKIVDLKWLVQESAKLEREIEEGSEDV